MIPAHFAPAALIVFLSIATGQPADPGYARKGLLVIQLSPNGGRYDSGFNRAEYYPALAQSIVALPGVLSASFIHIGPLKEVDSISEVRAILGGTVKAVVEVIAPDCFRTLRIPLLRGRDFTWRDRLAAPPVAILNESVARSLFPNSDPIGRSVQVGNAKQAFQIIGVVRDAHLWTTQSDAAIYTTLLQSNYDEQQLVLRTTGDPTAFIPAVRRQIEGMGRETLRTARTVE
jgi:putative ABC transport system permease protein